MWNVIGNFYRHTELSEYEIHKGTQGSRFELRNTITGSVRPLFPDNPCANIYTVMDVVEEFLATK